MVILYHAKVGIFQGGTQIRFEFFECFPSKKWLQVTIFLKSVKLRLKVEFGLPPAGRSCFHCGARQLTVQTTGI
jgi:hypothetical protein